MSQQGKQSGKFRRGNTWKREETLALLEIWGEAKVQQELRFSHRNLDIFEKISQDLRTKGYHRSAFECRTKTKTLRLEYKRVVVHNSRSGNTPAMCPFFPQLHRILRGDASVAPKRVARSFTLRWPMPNQVPHQDHGDVAAAFAQPLLEKDLEVQDIHMGDGGEYLAHPESAPEQTAHPEGHVIFSPEKEEGEEEEEEEEEQKVEGQHSLDARLPEQEFKVEGQPCAPGPSASEDRGTHVPKLATLSPAARLSMLRNKKRRAPMVQIIADSILQNAEKDRELLARELAAERKRSDAFLQVLENEARERSLARQEISRLNQATLQSLQVLNETLQQLLPPTPVPSSSRVEDYCDQQRLNQALCNQSRPVSGSPGKVSFGGTCHT
ncbi:zinc finger and SCAN domain-containing protein 32-like [Python bivittatus]|uniref:Zinc finger and SCAN domain-containing protein 32-like n=1 Tax=Python bivittatus TaxID=176946 RepID=A0A9F2R7W2_PYTBI|nr:zinc finger and SCAN domain-containing protein 32-like [Python bivittatus]